MFLYVIMLIKNPRNGILPLMGIPTQGYLGGGGREGQRLKVMGA